MRIYVNIVLAVLGCLFLIDGNAQVRSLERVILKNQEHPLLSLRAKYDSLEQVTGKMNKAFERWYDFSYPRSLPLSKNKWTKVNYPELYNTLMEELDLSAAQAAASHTGDWKYIGGDHYSVKVLDSGARGGSGGAGRLNCIAIDPGNSNIIYVGSALGGLWRSTDKASTWSCLTDGMGNIAVSSIAIDPNNSNVIYMAMCDADGSDDNSRAMGLVKSTDNGLSWRLMAPATRPIYKILHHPTNSDTQFICARDGFYSSYDGMETIDTIFNALGTSFNRAIWDAEFKPSNFDSIYFTTGITIRCYDAVTDQATRLLSLPTTNGSNRCEIEVSAQNPNLIIGLHGRRWADTINGFVSHPLSTDAGATWRFKGDTFNILSKDTLGLSTGSQATYDMCMVLDKTDPAKIMVGGIQIWTSQDTGDVHTCKSYGRRQTNLSYVHVDHHDMINQNDTIYVVNDGGLFRTTDFGESFTEISDGIGINQLYSIDSYEGNKDSIMGGLQDNGFYQYLSGEQAEQTYVGDGMKIYYHTTNSDIQYALHTDSRVNKTIDNWANVENIFPSNSNARFRSPFFMNKSWPDTLLVGSDTKVFITYNAGDTAWIDIGEFSPDQPIALEQSESSNSTIYAATITSSTQFNLFRCDNPHSMGPIWSDISSNLPDSLFISDIEADRNNHEKIWLSFSGFSQNQKVYYLPHGDSSWQNISAGLPNVPINDLEAEFGTTENGLYAGTDIGVFYRNDTLGQWIYFSNGLPNCVVNDLEYIAGDDIIRAATFGRGVWESDTYSSCQSSAHLTPATDPSNPLYTGVQRYQVKQGLSSTRTVLGGHGTDVKYRAGLYVDLEPGFEVRQHSLFTAEIGPCSSSGITYLKHQPITGRLITDHKSNTK